MSDTSASAVSGSAPATQEASSPGVSAQQRTAQQRTSASQGMSATRWAAALLLAAVAAWAMLNFTPIRFGIPQELMTVNMYSPPELQAEAAAKDKEAYWKNTLAGFGLAGLCFGLIPLMVAPWKGHRRRLVPVIAGLGAGIAGGLLAAVLGIYLRRYLDSGTALSMLGEGNRALVADILVYALVSVLLIAPATLALWVSGAQSQKMVALPLAAVVTGLLLPIIASLVLPAAQTNIFPPEGLALTGVWLGLLALTAFAFTSLTGSRETKDLPATAAGAA